MRNDKFLMCCLLCVALLSACAQDEDTSTADTSTADTSTADTSDSSSDISDGTTGHDTVHTSHDTSDPPDTTLPEGQCLSSDDCTATQGTYCSPTNPDRACGICFDEATPCTIDADCSSDPNGTLCDERPMCLCSPGPVCVPACTSNDDCSRDQVCLVSGHCGPQPCTDNSACPSDFACDTTLQGCLRRTCQSSADCNAPDVCVNGACELTPGLCDFPVP